MESLMSLQRRWGKRTLAVTVFALIVLFHTIYTFSGSSPTLSPATEDASDAQNSGSTAPQAQPPVEDEPAEPPRPQPERKSCDVTKVSMLYGTHRFPQLEGALDSHRRHSERWGCGFVSLDQDLTERKLYSKHYFLMSTMIQEMIKPLEQRVKWLMWVDADSILINPAISPSAFLPPETLPDVFALVTADHQGLNNGIFYLKVGHDALDMLTQMADYPFAHPDDDLGWFGEQAAMEHVISTTEKRLEREGRPRGIAWVPRLWFNTFEWEHAYEGEPGHFLVHFAGLAETRIQHMANWLTELQDNQAKWEIPFEDTFYAKEAPEFWRDFAAKAT